MPFELETTTHFDKAYYKSAKKNRELKKAIDSKVKQILENPYRFKPMHKPLQGFRQVHIMKSFVLLYSIKEKSVVLIKFEHHDKAYK